MDKQILQPVKRIRPSSAHPRRKENKLGEYLKLFYFQNYCGLF